MPAPDPPDADPPGAAHPEDADPAPADHDKSAPDASDPKDAVPIVPIEDAIDLHGFQPRDIPSVVEEYIRAAAEKGYREVRLIHGRGTGFQRQRVRQVLASIERVERFADAPPTRGGWGATLVWLKRQPGEGP